MVSDMKPSGIGGQAVIEGIMMRNKDKYSIAVRKPDNEIEVVVRESRLITEKHPWLNLPIIRGIVNFVDSLVTGISTINYSASFYDDPAEQEKTKIDEVGKNILKDKFESVLMAVTVILSIFFAIGLFMVLPYLATRLISKYIISKALLNFIEGIVRLLIFVIYVSLISMMKDIKRTFMYHGAEHKCINCIENGARLTPENVKNSSRYHKRCGTSFLFFVMFISIVFFIFIRVDNVALQILVRILLVPVIAGVSYEVIRWAGKNDNAFVRVLSKPGMWFQKLTTREPDMDMIEVAIKAVEEVFEKELSGLGIGSWTEPNGGYFISFEAMDGCAKAIAAKCKEAGVKLTGAGATFPYGKDPKDSNIRIAPSFPTPEELKQAADLFVLCVKIVSVEKLLENK